MGADTAVTYTAAAHRQFSLASLTTSMGNLIPAIKTGWRRSPVKRSNLPWRQHDVYAPYAPVCGWEGEGMKRRQPAMNKQILCVSVVDYDYITTARMTHKFD